MVLITGGSQGLGEAMAVHFAQKGADIVLVSRSEEKLKKALSNVEVRDRMSMCLTTVGCARVSGSKVYVSQCGLDRRRTG